MDHIHEAFMELRCLRIIIDELPYDMLKLDISRLWSLGYLLLYCNNNIIFKTINDFQFMYNPNLYIGDVIPKSTLSSYTHIKSSSIRCSP